jgi:hypothetical protein
MDFTPIIQILALMGAGLVAILGYLRIFKNIAISANTLILLPKLLGVLPELLTLATFIKKNSLDDIKIDISNNSSIQDWMADIIDFIEQGAHSISKEEATEILAMVSKIKQKIDG